MFKLLFTLLTIGYFIDVSSAFCYEDSQCPGYELCLNNKCQRGSTGTGKKCSTSNDCPKAKVCLNHECGCSSSFECYGSEMCKNFICQGTGNKCIFRNECPTGQICLLNHCTNCAYTAQCNYGESCINGLCITKCSFDSSCGIFEKCIHSICREPRINGPCEFDRHCKNGQICRVDICRDEGGLSTPVQVMLWLVGITFLIIVVFGIKKACDASRGRIVPPPRQPRPPPPPPPAVITTSSAIPVASGPIMNETPYQPYQVPYQPYPDPPPPVYSVATANQNPAAPPPPYNPYYKN